MYDARSMPKFRRPLALIVAVVVALALGAGTRVAAPAPLIAALAPFTDSSGRTFDYTTLVDGYGTHIYPPADTTLHLVQHASSDLIAQAADLPHLAQKPLWITEWSENGSAFWSSHKWYFSTTATA